MTMKLSGAIVAMVLGLMGGTVADAADCRDAQTQNALNGCAADAFQTADAALNETYGALRHRLLPDPGADRKLVQAQRAWIAFRDAECAFLASSTESGSIAGLVTTLCKTRLTEARMADLSELLRCETETLDCALWPAREEPSQ